MSSAFQTINAFYNPFSREGCGQLVLGRLLAQ